MLGLAHIMPVPERHKTKRSGCDWNSQLLTSAQLGEKSCLQGCNQEITASRARRPLHL